MWDCKYKAGKDGCRRRNTRCYPGGKRCVLGQKFSFPLRKQTDELEQKKETKFKTTKTTIKNPQIKPRRKPTKRRAVRLPFIRIRSITPPKAKEHIEKQGGTVIDIRAREVFDQGHIPGAVWVDKDNLAVFIQTADKKETIICCCYKGISSLKVAEALQKAGFSKACSLKGGFEGWSQTFPKPAA